MKKLLLTALFAAAVFTVRAEVQILDHQPGGCLYYPWGNLKAEVVNDTLVLKLPANASDWCGVNISINAAVDITDEVKNGKLTFQVNAGPNVAANTVANQKFQVALSVLGPEGKTLTGTYVPVNLTLDTDPATWQDVEIPVSKLLLPVGNKIKNMQVQFQVLPAERSDITLRNIFIK